MSTIDWIRFGVFLAATLLLAYPLGSYIARVFSGEARIAEKVLGPIERVLYRLSGVSEENEMTARTYAASVLVFSLVGMLFAYAIQRLQAHLPLNPDGLAAVPPK